VSDTTAGGQCVGCGEPYMAGDGFCQNCGRPIPPGHGGSYEPGADGWEHTPPGRSLWLSVTLPIGGLVLLAAGVVAALLLVRGHAPPVASSVSTPAPSPAPSTDEGVEGSSAPSSPQDTGPDGSTGPVPRPLNSVAVAYASATSPDNVDGTGHRTTYEAANLLDADPTTAWRTDGDGTGVVLTFTLGGPHLVTELGLVNGYAKTDPATGEDRYGQERRILIVSWAVGGNVYRERLVDGVRDLQVIDIPSAKADVVQLRIDAVTQPGDANFDKTPISDVLIAGA